MAKLEIDITQEQVRNLEELARQKGLSVRDYALSQLFGEATTQASAPPITALSNTAALFAAWAREDETDDSDELARRQEEGDELLANLENAPFSLRQISFRDEVLLRRSSEPTFG